MADRESVITHLQIIHTWAEFARERDLQFFTAKHLEDIARWADDALNLLKEQEPIKALITGHGEFETEGTWWYECGNCGTPIDPSDNFCRKCGRAVEWDAAD